MDFINQFLPENILYALGWTVVHSLWQAFAVALLLAAYLLGWQKMDARKRYLAGYLALASTLLLAAVTFVFYFGKSQTAPGLIGGLAAADGTAFGQSFVEGRPSFFSEYFNENMPLIVTVWALGLVFFMLKMLGGLLYIQRLRQRYASPMPRQWQEVLGSLAAGLGLGRTIRLAESALVRVPMVVGWLKPIILMPLGAVNNLTPAQVEAILAHELAHIARHDYLLNLMQSVVEILFYFNPAVWWISSNIRTERENCCDDIAVRLCGNSLAYAKALVSLQEMHQATPAFAMSFSKNKNQLLTRIQRILQPSNNKSNVMEKLSATFLLTVAVVLLSVQANTPFGNLLDRLVLQETPEAAAVAPADDVFFRVQTDTVPNGNRETHITRKTDNEDIEIKMKNDEIISLKINGEEIPPERYGEYSELTQELMEDIPEPPTPPTPPMPPMPEMAPMAPMAPMPPMPPSPGSKTRKIITQKDGNGTSFIIEDEDGSEPVEIKVKNGKKGTIIVNGQEITGMKKGDKTVILQEVESAPGAFYWNSEGFEMPELAFSPDDFHFEFPEPASAWQLDAERFRANSEMLRELQNRMREGTATQEWLEEHQRAMREDALAPHLLELEAIRGHLDEERARMEEHRHKAMEEQMLQLEKLHGQQMEQHRQVEERIQKEMEKHQRKLEKELQKKRKTSM
ncbi:MAG: M48 family metalloprotease [Bacteroidetes bacterium]|nr:M48 family metalloprotease [Bacteroidota bacterium]